MVFSCLRVWEVALHELITSQCTRSRTSALPRTTNTRDQRHFLLYLPKYRYHNISSRLPINIYHGLIDFYSEKRVLGGTGGAIRGLEHPNEHGGARNTLQLRKGRGFHRSLAHARDQQRKVRVRRGALHPAAGRTEESESTLVRAIHAATARLEDRSHTATWIWESQQGNPLINDRLFFRV